MKILFLQDDFPPFSFGGAGISTFELALGMKKAGHDVSVITTCRKKSEAGESDYQDLKVYKIATDYQDRWRWYVSLYNRQVVPQVERILQKIKPDVVHVNNVHTYLSYQSLKVAKRYSKAVVFTARDAMTFNFAKLETNRYLKELDCHTTWRDHMRQAGKRWNPLRNFFIKRYLKNVDKIFAISNALKEALQQNGLSGVDVIYNGIDVGRWQVAKEDVEKFRKNHNLENKKILLFCGRLSAAKGGGKALEALSLVIKQIPDTVLLVAGAIDDFAKAMLESANNLGVSKNVIFTGWLDEREIKFAYQVANVVLMPSIYLDAFGRVNIEAMASKKPIVSTCYGGSPEIVIDGVTGYIVNPFDIEKLAGGVVDLLGNPTKADLFGDAGFERVKSNFNLDDKVNEYLGWYQKLLDQRGEIGTL